MSDLTTRLGQLSAEQRARLAERVAAVRAPAAPETFPPHAIAIVGMSCRLPGSVNSPAALWELLQRGEDAVTPVPPDRWDGEAFFDADPDASGKIAMREAGFLADVAGFDAEYFGISPFEARQMDPQQRLFLEVAIEALEHAGLTRARLAGSMCGVFVGVHSHSLEYYAMQAASLSAIDTYTSTGTAHSVIANRLSYFLDLRGPSMAIDTACSSSLVAMHQACLSLRAGESTVAVVGGMNLILTPEASVAFTKLRVLSSRGRCRTFDASADGIARGEGCAALVLKRAADAVRDGDPILAIVRGSAINQDGATNGLTAPSTTSQIAVIRAALATAQLEPHRVGFVETHGTGTSLGDPIEVEAIAATYGLPRPQGDVVVLGALKSNIGHLEGAAGVAAVIKTVQCLRHGSIPRNLHFDNLNPLVRLEGTSIELANSPRAWTTASLPRVGAVSSFGFGGTNAHVILEEAPIEPPTETVSAGAWPLVVSARTPAALGAQVRRWSEALRGPLRDASTRDVAYTACVRRDHHGYRVAVAGRSPTDLADRLDAWARLPDREDLRPTAAGERRKIAFVFCGQGPQWFAMARDLLDGDALFRDVVARVAAVVQRVAGWDLQQELQRDEATTRIHETEITQPAMFAVQMGLVAVWRARGVEPDFVIGHSMGEIAAACAAGAIDLEEGARIAILRGQAVKQAEGLGGMIAFPISAVQAAEFLTGLEDRVGIAAINAPSSVVLAGDAASLASIAARVTALGLEGRTLEVRYASHSPQMAPLVEWLHAALGTVQHRAPSIPMYSSISHDLVTGATLDAAHWSAGLRRAVDFSGGVAAALAAGCRAFVDVAPHPVMATSVRECADAAGVEVLAVPSLRRQAAADEQMLQSMGELFVGGVDVRWEAVLGGRGRVLELPEYPWQHEHYWIASAPSRRAPDGVAAGTVEVLHDVRWRAASHETGLLATPVRAWTVIGGSPTLSGAVLARLGRGDVDARAWPETDLPGAVGDAITRGGDLIDLRGTSWPADGDSLAREVAAADAARALIAARGSLAVAEGGVGRVWITTRGAQRIASERPDDAQATMWGIGRVAAVEMPGAWGGLIDLDPDGSDAQHADDILQAVSAAGADLESVFRAGVRYVPRLERVNVSALSPTLHAEGYYVVTGGLGGVGLVVAEWLVRQGARRLLLVGRTMLPPRAQWSDATLETGLRTRIDGVRRLEALGAAVRVSVLDASDAAALARDVDQCRSEGWGRARGILHCATDVQFGLLTDASRDDLAAMMRSKVGAAEALMTTFRDDAPEFYVMFSSLGSLLGERGQGTYAAANAGLDAWALTRRLRGDPVSVINWGAWENTGLAATRGGDLVTEGLLRRGVRPVSPAKATAALGAVIAHGLPSASVLVTGDRVAPDGARDPWHMLSGLWPAAEERDAAPTSGPLDALRQLADGRERLRALTTLVHDVIADTLGITDSRIDPDRPLGALGMDSLMAIRIRRRCERLFGLTLSATTLFSYPTVGALAQLLYERLSLGDAAVVAAASSDTPVVGSVATPVTVVSDEEALAALRARRGGRKGVS